MKINLPLECEQCFDDCKTHIMASYRNSSSLALDQKQVEECLPHRPPLLLINSVENLDKENNMIQATCDLAKQKPMLKSFNPNIPQMPEVLQVEAIGQAGLILNLKTTEDKTQAVQITHIFLSEFFHPISFPGIIDIRARAFEYGYFLIVVGQCIFQNQISSVSIIQGLTYIQTIN